MKLYICLSLLLLSMFLGCTVAANEDEDTVDREPSHLGKRTRDQGPNDDDRPWKISSLSQQPVKRFTLPSKLQSYSVDKNLIFPDSMCKVYQDGEDEEVCERILSSVLRGDASDDDIIGMILDFNITNLSFRDQEQNILHLAVAAGRNRLVRFLVDRMRNEVSLRDPYGKTALYIAVELKLVEIAGLLVDHGAEVSEELICRAVTIPQNCEVITILLRNLKQKGHEDPVSPIFAAIEQNNNLENVLCLMSSLNMNVVDENGRTPLIAAATKSNFDEGDYQVLEALAEVEPKLEQLLELEDESRLDLIFRTARNTGNEKLVRLLWGHEGVALAFKASGLSDLHVAASLPSGNWLEELLRKRVDTGVVDKYMRTPLHTASGLGNARCVQLLLESGANVNAADRNGKTALHYPMFSKFLNKAVIELLVANKVDLDAQDSHGTTALTANALQIRVYEQRFSEAVRTLNITPLELTGYIQTHYEVLRYLLSSGANPVIRDKRGYSPMLLLPNEVMQIAVDDEIARRGVAPAA